MNDTYNNGYNQGRSNSKVLAIVSLALGILGLVFSCLVVGIVFAVPALILGIISLVKKLGGKGMAIAGVITGGLAVVFALFILVGLKNGMKAAVTESEIFSAIDEIADADSLNTNITEDAIETEGNMNNELDSPEDSSEAYPEGRLEVQKKYYPGVYEVGTDIPEGEYLIRGDETQVSGLFVYDDYDLVTQSGEPIHRAYYYKQVYVTVKNGEFLQFENGDMIHISQAELYSSINESDVMGPGMYKVGLDIPVGKYVIKPDEERAGYYDITWDGGRDSSKIIACETPEALEEIDLQEGQYVNLYAAIMYMK